MRKPDRTPRYIYCVHRESIQAELVMTSAKTGLGVDVSNINTKNEGDIQQDCNCFESQDEDQP